MNNVHRRLIGKTLQALKISMVRSASIPSACTYTLVACFVCAHSSYHSSYANMTLDLPCIIDNTTYTDFGTNGEQFQQVFTRDNCRTPDFYCDDASMTCQRTKAIGQNCLADQECKEVRLLYSFSRFLLMTLGQNNCGTEGLCEEPPEAPLKIALWQYAITGLCITGGGSSSNR
jgi:hypothetical protein